MSENLSGRRHPPASPAPTVEIITFGFRHGEPEIPLADVLDVRVLHNPPDEDSGLLELNGLDRRVREHVYGTPGSFELIYFTAADICRNLAAGYYPRNHAILLIGCAFGRHRSVVVGEAIKKALEYQKIECTIRHRDIAEKAVA